MAGVVPVTDTQGSTALKALSTQKLSNCILQSLQLLRNSDHCVAVAKLPKHLSLKIPNVKSTGELLEQMPSVIVALDSHLDNATRSSLMLQEIRSILHDSSHRPPAPLPLNHLQEPRNEL